MFTTEFEFELPRGYIDEKGEIHKKGVMRLATAADEITPLKDVRVQQNPGYLTIILLSRVIKKIGNIENPSTKVIENLFTADLAFLQDMYQKINSPDEYRIKTVCPKCNEIIDVPINFTQGE